MDNAGRTDVQAVDRPRLTLRGAGMCVAAAVVFVAASVVSNRDLLMLACVLAAMPVTAYLYVRRRRMSLEIFRSFSPEIVSVDATSVVTLEVRNRSDRATTAMLCRDDHESGNRGPVLDLPALAPAAPQRPGGRSQAMLRYSWMPPGRGIHSVGPLVVRESDLLGLVFWDRALGTTQSLAVTPRITPLQAERLSSGGADGSADSARLSATGGADDTLPREYRPGDAMRRVHWRSTARHGDLMVRQDEQQNDPQCWVIVDNYLTSHDRQVKLPATRNRGITSDSFEWAVSLAASIAMHARQEGYLARLVETADPAIAAADDPRGEPASERELLLELAAMRLIGGRAHSDYASKLSSAIRSSGGARPLFAVIGRMQEAEAEHLARLGPLGKPATAFIINGSPDVRRVLEGGGWLCIGATENDDPELAWLSMISQRGSAHATG